MALKTEDWTIDDIRRQLAALEPGESWSLGYPLTVDEYLEMVPEKLNVELVDGVIVMPSPTSYEHESLFSFLYRLLGNYVEDMKLGEVLGSRTAVRADEFNAPEPDILFIARRRRRLIKRLEVAGAPDLVMEIIWSRSSRSEATAKVARYQRVGVGEIWMIDIPRRFLRLLRRSSAGKYRISFDGGAGVARSRIVRGFAVRAEWLWMEPGRFPSVRQLTEELQAGRVPETESS